MIVLQLTLLHGGAWLYFEVTSCIHNLKHCSYVPCEGCNSRMQLPAAALCCTLSCGDAVCSLQVTCRYGSALQERSRDHCQDILQQVSDTAVQVQEGELRVSAWELSNTTQHAAVLLATQLRST